MGQHRQFFENLSRVLPLLPALLHLDSRFEFSTEVRTSHPSSENGYCTFRPVLDVLLGPKSPPQIQTLVIARSWGVCTFIPCHYQKETDIVNYACPVYYVSSGWDIPQPRHGQSGYLQSWHDVLLRLATKHATLKRIWMVGVTMGLSEIKLLKRVRRARGDAVDGCDLMVVYDKWDIRKLAKLPFQKLWKHRKNFGKCARDLAMGCVDSHLDVEKRLIVS
ncbi:hypothetical protein BC829DRAFT_127990 [Chytridium lagenaria]|nr:hypothetical protein BC829DRAFT_127990 [Chytridium lagenaria]